MLLMRFLRAINGRNAIAVINSALLASSVVLAGCGRTPTDPLAPGGGTTSTKPAPGEGEEPDPGFPDPAPGGGGVGPAPGGGTGGGAPAPGKPAPKGGLRPLPKPTPVPPAKGGSGGGDPAAEMKDFVTLLKNFGYAPGANAVQNVRMQVSIVTRVPANRFHWVDSQNLVQTYERRKAGFPAVPSFQQWKDEGIKLAQRYSGVSYVVGRRALYRDIFYDRYKDQGSDVELILYKRLNRTQFYVSYRANGQLDDYGYFRVDDWREFLPVPEPYWTDN